MLHICISKKFLLFSEQNQISKMSAIYYPNDCYVCKTRTSIKRCSRCQLISYCGEVHQKQDWQSHKEFCGVISKLMKITNFSHIYQGLAGCFPENWTLARTEMISRVSSILDHSLQPHEIQMLNFPRSCFICFDTTQENLTNCPNCPLVSFCKKHPFSPLHNKECSKINSCYTFEIECANYQERTLEALLQILHEPWMEISFPNSSYEFLAQTLNPMIELNEMTRKYLMLFISPSLTILSAMQKLNYVPSSTLTIDVQTRAELNNYPQHWEILLHFLPNVKYLKIGLDRESVITIEQDVRLCEKCTRQKRKLITVTKSNSESEDYETPDLAVLMNIKAREDDSDVTWEILTAFWSAFNCPLIFMSGTETHAKRLRKKFNSPEWRRLICFNGHNNFSSGCLYRSSDNWMIGEENKFLLVINAFESHQRKKKHFRNRNKSSEKNSSNGFQNYSKNSTDKFQSNSKNSSNGFQSYSKNSSNGSPSYFKNSSNGFQSNSKELKEKVDMKKEIKPAAGNSNIEPGSSLAQNVKEETIIESVNLNIESLLKNNLLVKAQEEFNKMFQENLCLKEENERLRNEMLKLKNSKFL